MENSKLLRQQALIRDQARIALYIVNKCINYAAKNKLPNMDLYSYKLWIKYVQKDLNGKVKYSFLNDIERNQQIFKKLEQITQEYKDYIEQITGSEYRD